MSCVRGNSRGLYNQNLDWPIQRLDQVKDEIRSLRTPKWRLYRIGLPICLAVSVLLVGMLRFKLWDARNFRTINTPKSRLRFLVIASVAWFALLPAALLQINDEYAMDDLTPFADTGHGMFLVFGPPLFVVIWVVAIVVGRFVVLRNVLLPANLW